MVYYFKSVGADGSFESNPRFIYMGKDKMENEDLIKYGFDEDVWFHVDNLSSAHVYLRLDHDEKWDQIPEPILYGGYIIFQSGETYILTLLDCAQLTKANSIEGNKRDNITVIYTPWSNLKKTKGMADGEVSFKSTKKVKKIHIQTRENSIINRLKKTREEIKGRNHLIEAKTNRDTEYTQRLLQVKKQEKLKDEEEKRKIAEEKKRQETLYDDLFDDQEIDKTSNKKRMYDPEDDFW